VDTDIRAQGGRCSFSPSQSLELWAAAIASVSGFGIGSLLTPLLAAQYGMRPAVAAVSIPHMIATALRFWRLRRDVDRHVLFGFEAMNAAGSLAGALVHVWVNNPILSIVLGILLVFAGIIGVLGYANRMRFGKRMSWIAGAVSGGFGGLVGNQGGIRSAAMLGPGIQGPAFVATATAIGIVVDTVRMPVYLATESAEMSRALRRSREMGSSAILMQLMELALQQSLGSKVRRGHAGVRSRHVHTFGA
jgi:uncharacterized protein